MASVKCPICMSVNVVERLKAKDYISEERFTVYLCKKCAVGFTWPQPEDVNRYYPANYRRFAAPAKWLLQILYGLRVKRWVRQFGHSGRALEIGCGSGWMLEALHNQGWDVVGLERTEEEAKFASLLTGLTVLSGSIVEIPSEPQYDLILLFNVLEHVVDPRTMIRQCSRLLKEGGTIILSMHNLASWQAYITGPYWFHLDVPRHLFHFSPQSLANALEIEGLELVHTRFISVVHDPYGWLQSLLNCFGFKQNRLTQGLTGGNRREFISLSGLGMTLVAMLLVIPSLLLSVSSWLVQSGAIIEVRARRKRGDALP